MREIRVLEQEAEVVEIRPGWYDKPEIAEYFCCSIRWIERRMEEGMPHAHIAGRAKFKPDECESWLEAHGHLKRKGEPVAA